jgi:hypothetical protein
MIGLIPGVVGLGPRLRVRLRLVPVFDPSESFSPDCRDYPESWDHIPVTQKAGPDLDVVGLKQMGAS